MNKKISIAVVGDTASGKTYLLYDLIHAFHQLGYEPQQLPLDYPHSSFGKFFFDTINASTGGMMKTDVVALRPENHYGAHLADRHGNRFCVDFLNIPGEVFSDHSRIQDFFKLKKSIERNKRGIFWLAEYCSPSGHRLRLVFPKKDFVPRVITSGTIDLYRNWGNIAHLINTGGYKRVSCKGISGSQLIKQFHTIMTDTVLLTIKEKWSLLMGTDSMLDVNDFEEHLVRRFYPLVYCQNATDLIVCDSLFRGTHTGILSGDVNQFYSNPDEKKVPNVFLAFRDSDMLLKEQLLHYKNGNTFDGTTAERTNIYALCVEKIVNELKEAGSNFMDNETRQHIRLSASKGAGKDFWHLINKSLLNKGKKLADMGYPLPPHVYFTATPIDAELNVYENDIDTTRFIFLEQEEGVFKSFVHENCSDMSHHFCFGSLQLLMDILAQHKVYSRKDIKNMPKTLHYFLNI